MEMGWPPVHPDQTDVRVLKELPWVPAGGEPHRHDGVEWEVVVPLRLELTVLDPDPIIDDLDEAAAGGVEILLRKSEEEPAPLVLPVIDEDWLFCPIAQDREKFSLYGSSDVFGRLLAHFGAVPGLDDDPVVGLALVAGLLK